MFWPGTKLKISQFHQEYPGLIVDFEGIRGKHKDKIICSDPEYTTKYFKKLICIDRSELEILENVLPVIPLPN